MKKLFKGCFLILFFSYVYSNKFDFVVEGLYNTANMKEFNDFIEKQKDNIITPLSNLGFSPNSSIYEVNQFSGFELGVFLVQNEKFSFIFSYDHIVSNNCGWHITSAGVWIAVPYEYDIKLDLKNYLTSLYGGVSYNLSSDVIKIKPAILFGYGFGELKGKYKYYSEFGNQIKDTTKDIQASGKNLVAKLKVFLDYFVSPSISLNLSFGYRMATIPELKYEKDVDLNDDGKIESDVDLVHNEPVKDKETSDTIEFDYSGFFLSLGVLFRF